MSDHKTSRGVCPNAAVIRSSVSEHFGHRIYLAARLSGSLRPF
jgi:hypothetical protein